MRLDVNSITVTPRQPSIPAGVQQRFNATAAFNDGTTQHISNDVGWTSGTPSVASISSLGVANSLAQGTTTITGSFIFSGQNVSGAAQLMVNAATLSSIAITPRQTVLPVGKTIAYQAQAKFSDGSAYFITTLANWNSSDTTLVKFTIPAVATTLKPGPPVTITATYKQPGGQTITSNNASVIVTQFPLTGITVGSATARVPVGVTTQFQATGTFSDGSTQALTNYATWASNPPSVATVSNGVGQQGIALGIAPGQTLITAAFAGVISNQAPLTVSTATIQSLTVTPNPASAPSGAQLQFKALGQFDDGSSIDLTTQVIWNSSDVTVATINNIGMASIAGQTGKTSVIKATFTQNGITVSDQSNLTVQ